SRYNGKEVSNHSDEDGVVKLDITELAEPLDEDGTYSFNGTIDGTCPGYRTFHMALARISGATGMVVPTRELEPDRPYPVSVSFDEWDALYTTNTFVLTSGNTDDHTFHIHIEELPAAASISLLKKGQDGALATATLSPTEGKAEADMVAPFLKQGYEHALEVGGQYYMQLTCAGYIYEFPIAIAVMLGCAAAPEAEEDTWLSPINNTTTPDAFAITLPDFIPLFGGQKFYPWVPNWKVSFVLDPFGYFYLAWKSPRVGYVSDGGSTDPNRWGKHTYESASKQFTKALDSAMDSSLSAYAKISKGAAATQLSFTKQFTCALSLRIEAIGKWDWAKGNINGYAGAQAMFELGFAFTEQFALGPVPIYISFGVSANFIAALGVGFQAAKALDFSTYEFDYTNSGLTATFNISPYLSVGAGLYGIASVGGKGTLTLTAFTGLTATPGPQYTLPHNVVGSNGQIMAEVQLFLYKWSGTLLSYDEPRIHDSWEDDANQLTDAPALMAPSAPYTLADGSLSYTAPQGALASTNKTLWQILTEDMTPVTDEELGGSCEVQLSSITNDMPLYDEESMALAIVNEAGEEVARELPMLDAYAVDVESSPWSQTVLKQPAQPEITFGVSKVEEKNGGIWPKIDRELMNDIFSDPRMKVVSTKNPSNPNTAREYIFRIASVKVNGQMRTRVVYHTSFKGAVGPANVVEFYSSSSHVSRDNDNDYDFDVTVSPEGTDIYLTLIYGPRPTADGTTISAEWNDISMAYVRFSVASGAITGYRTCTWTPGEVDTSHAEQHLVFCPRITHLEGNGADSVVAISWLHRYAYTADGGLGSSGAHMTLSAAACAHESVYDKYEVKDSAVVDDLTTYDLLMSRLGQNDDGTWNLFFVTRGEEGCTAYTARLDQREIPPYTYPQVFDFTCLGSHELNARLTPWPGHEGFLSSYNNKLVHVMPGTSGNVFSIEDTGIGDFDVNSFGVDPTGTFIYFAQNRSGVVGREYDEEGNSTPIEADENRLMALKIYNGVFTDPYVLCNVKHPMENIVCLSPETGAMLFLSAGITDFSSSKASMWVTAVPCTAVFTILGAAAVPPVVAAGDVANILVTLRNDGNVHLTGAQMTIRDEGGQVLASEWLPFTTETLQASMWNPPQELREGEAVMLEPNLTNVRTRRAGLLNAGANGELAPGKTGVYAAHFTLPEDWSDDHFVTVTLGDPEWVAASTLPGDERPVTLDASLQSGRLGLASAPPEANVDYETTKDAPVTMRKIDDTPGGDTPGGDTPGGDTPGGDTPGGDTPGGDTPGGDTPGGDTPGGDTPGGDTPGGDTPGGGGGSDTPDTPVMPGTGDAAGPLLGATAALAALGAGFAAYSARRTAIENERMNDGEER
ncbi:MAG: hypothetical protein IJG53_06820, partial [Eggerthellaceae bacterium]|nr:hypothetical protein [Eggerthellaceae bacterium]